ncbi:MAG: hypothetical protein JJ975_09755 [Bacteroidia bacterium]|nr:hypothetical protein [Bacteroidia bacterium]
MLLSTQIQVPIKKIIRDLEILISKNRIELECQDEKIEDMFQAEYVKGKDVLIMDIGYYEGIKAFKYYIVKDRDWDEPVHAQSFNNLNDLIMDLNLFLTRQTSGN